MERLTVLISSFLISYLHIIFNFLFYKNVLIVFRGGYSRVKAPNFVCQNVCKFIFNSLQSLGFSYDVFFSTYNDNPVHLKIYKKAFNPKKIFFTANGQINNFKETLVRIKPFVHKYKFVIFLRFEAIYKIPINKWNFFDKKGLILPFKEDTEALYKATGWYNDSIIICSTCFFSDLYFSVLNAAANMYQPENTLHNLANTLLHYNKDIPIHTLVEGFFQSNHWNFPQEDSHLSPLFILVHHPYKGSDKAFFGL